MTDLNSILKSRDITLLTKSSLVKTMVFSVVMYRYEVFFSSHVQIRSLDHKQDWVMKNWCFLTVVLEETLESPLDCKEMKPVNLKENQPWIFLVRTSADAAAPLLKGCCWAIKNAGILGLQRRGIQSGARDKACPLRTFVVIKFYLGVEEIEKASDIDIQRGQKEWCPASL